MGNGQLKKGGEESRKSAELKSSIIFQGSGCVRKTASISQSDSFDSILPRQGLNGTEFLRVEIL